jgi:hypothetical protein|eukprot:COSAG01_NODE_54_length_31327_cov_317.045356_3_plen_78_part_00
MNDPIYAPAHYMQNGVECIDVMAAIFGKEMMQAYCLMNAFKYMFRMHHKDTVEANTQKAVWFLLMGVGADPRKHTRK